MEFAKSYSKDQGCQDRYLTMDRFCLCKIGIPRSIKYRIKIERSYSKLEPISCVVI